jgi:hypothetical protein
MTAGLFTMLGSYYTLKALMGAIAQFIISILIALAVMIAIFWIFPFTWGVAATSTSIFVALAIPMAIILAFMVDVLHVNTSYSIPKIKCFDKNTIIDMTAFGDGTANLQPVLLEGIITKPGRYINDDGHLSSFNFLEDRDYYQNFSFVVRVKESISNYRNALKDLAQPAGTKLFGDYVNALTSVNVENYVVISNTEVILSKDGTFRASNSNSVYIYVRNHGFANNDNVYVEFNSGVTVNTVNGIYMVSNVLASNVNTFNVRISSAATAFGNATITLVDT